MSAVEDLTELVERAGAAERAALASRWKEREDVDALRRRVESAITEQHDLERLSRRPTIPKAMPSGENRTAKTTERTAIVFVPPGRLPPGMVGGGP